jgi:hypothetical protein
MKAPRKPQKVRTVRIIRSTIEACLRDNNFPEGSWSWVDRPNTLIILVRGKMRHIPMKAGLSQGALLMYMALITGWAEGLGLVEPGFTTPTKTTRPYVNGAAAHTEQLSLSV